MGESHRETQRERDRETEREKPRERRTGGRERCMERREKVEYRE